MTTEDALDISRIFGYLSEEEVLFIKLAVITLVQREDAVAVNIGAGAGTSGLAILESHPTITLYTVDIRKDGPLGSLVGEMNAIKKSGVDYKGRYWQILGDSKIVGKNFDHEIDFLFIDGDHSRDGIRGDFDVWLPRVREGGVILVDDYDQSDSATWPEVAKAVDEILFQKYKFFGREDSVIGFTNE